ncbi:hypothetical protein [Tritonibacter scottomollicae]|uniref:Cytochrome c domain-containing protein n=1 Tax=Tritonibacter scottomollicae TaxID=483013 RepID=A0A2T1AG64_TRISK|nr:hypothetical protein [Tritonibacter scottomollicae]PRZ47592.1 hypothetical protein CLV89_106125 [Tritonibacter scottomollicae]
MARATGISGLIGGALLAVLPGGPDGFGAQEARNLRLAAPQVLVDTGLFDYMLPRFSLKTQVRVSLVPSGAPAEVVIARDGVAVFADQSGSWHLQVLAPDHASADRFADWLLSEVGLRTVLSFAPEGAALFHAPEVAAEAAEEQVFDGDAEAGQALSLQHCGRCHVVSEQNRMKAIGSTPSFSVLRGFADWEERFSAFFVLKPHGAFTQIEDVTAPFDAERPSPIVPVEMTLDELDSILAYVALMVPADLGQPLQMK